MYTSLRVNLDGGVLELLGEYGLDDFDVFVQIEESEAVLKDDFNLKERVS